MQYLYYSGIYILIMLSIYAFDAIIGFDRDYIYTKNDLSKMKYDSANDRIAYKAAEEDNMALSVINFFKLLLFPIFIPIHFLISFFQKMTSLKKKRLEKQEEVVKVRVAQEKETEEAFIALEEELAKPKRKYKKSTKNV